MKSPYSCPHCNYKNLSDEELKEHISLAHPFAHPFAHLPKLGTTWTVKYQYQLPGTLEPGEVYTEDIEARFCNIIDGHLIFERDSSDRILRAFAPGRWIEVRLKVNDARKHQIGEKITTSYSDPPVSPEDRYKIGQEIGLSDIETGKRDATFKVILTDDTIIRGEIIE